MVPYLIVDLLSPMPVGPFTKGRLHLVLLLWPTANQLGYCDYYLSFLGQIFRAGQPSLLHLFICHFFFLSRVFAKVPRFGGPIEGVERVKEIAVGLLKFSLEAFLLGLNFW